MNPVLRLGKWRALIVLPFVPILLAVPAAMFWSSGGALVDDSRAFLGGGTDVGVPIVSSVHCVGSRSGSNSSRGLGMTIYGCVIDVTPPPPPAQDDPFKTLPYGEAMAEWSRRSLAEIRRVTDPANALGRIERSVPLNRTGTTPTLRRLSAEGEPKRFGVVWGADDLAVRWLHLLFFTALFWAPALGILILARKIWRGWMPSGYVAPPAGAGPAPTLNDNHPPR